MPNGKVYDPLIGQWMSPLWENVLDRVDTPTHLHLYRFNGNDPIDVRHTDRPNQPTGKFGEKCLVKDLASALNLASLV
ncbi:hypothetical protein K0M31_009998 [Melipona bicolor]|uniref:Teneurin-like YD-shell domain-containing protein n=1 Tax=Melipona bicolor TaxID=60889 RepID=A0AA40FMQ4_9HYME|nr:hypothetical protein K0M31_009998 [Melipona bicolor]